VLWYGDVLGADRLDLAVLVGGCDYREYTVWYDEAEALELRAAAEQFLQSIAEHQRPDIDAHGATYQAIRELHPEIDGTDVELPNELARRFIAARQLLARATEHEQQARSEIADVMGTAKRARWDDHTVATRQARGDGTPYVVAGRKLPDVTASSERTAA